MKHGNSKEFYMSRALKLAAQGAGYTSPNPMVGCVVVKDGRIISEGYHERYGQFHAERNALLNCKEDTQGAEIYVTLEPCCHHGKTPPCTDIIIEKGIKKVYIGSLDTNPKVAGGGIKQLKDAGIEIECGILEAECLKLNEVFFHYIETSRPFVAMKYAMSMDGKIATVFGDSKWITGDEARGNVQGLRKLYSGIMVGIGTVLMDNPRLNCRICEELNPTRIICDSRLRIPMDCNIVKTAKDIPTIVAYGAGADIEDSTNKIARLEDNGVRVIKTDGTEVNLDELMDILGKERIDSILLEGGGTLNASALRAKIVNKVYAFIGGQLLGGAGALTPIEGIGAPDMSKTIRLENLSTAKVGNDICITGYPVYPW